MCISLFQNTIMFRGVCKTHKYHVKYILHQKEITDKSKKCSTRLGKSKIRYSVMLRKAKYLYTLVTISQIPSKFK